MIVAFAGQKGGSGKTTTAISIACEELARGRRVLLVDADPQGSTSTFASVASEVGAKAPTIVSMGAGLHRPDQLPALAQGYDVTVIDCPPRHGEILKAALMVADLVVLPCGPSALDAWALGASVDLINEAKVIRPDLLAVVLITKKTARTAIGQGAREVLGASGLPVLHSEMFHRVTYAEAPAAGVGPSIYAPSSPAADEVRALADELEELAATTNVQQEAAANAL
jgi:chromosome partitioning protein